MVTKSRSTEIHDVVIVGAGMIGSAAALSLAQAGFTVCLLEANDLPQWSDDKYNMRVCAISKASEDLLSDVGVWQKIKAGRVSAYERMHVWEEGSSLDFDAADSGLPCLGYIVENNLINASLIEQCEAEKSIKLLSSTRVSSVAWNEADASLTLENKAVIRARLVIAADGGNSGLRQQAGIESSIFDYRQTGIVTRVKTSLPHQATAWQRFLKTGPLALLPLSDGSCSIVWSVESPLAEDLLALDDESFSTEITAAFEGRLGDITVQSTRAGFPLFLSNAEHYVKDRLVLLGDAAHRVHPLAGQGVNLGFQDVMALTETLLKSVASGRDIADPLYLRRYARQRRAELTPMIYGMHAIQRVFSSNTSLVKTSRRYLMKSINRIPFFKQVLIDRALGRGGVE